MKEKTIARFSIVSSLWALMKREVRILASRRIYWFILIFAPLFSFLFFMDILKEGLPADLPVAVVDRDNSTTSRALARSLNTFAQSEVKIRTADFGEAREAMQRNEVYGIFYIPENFAREAAAGKEPLISFYTNDSYLLAGSLLYKDMRMQAGLANGSVQQTLLLAQGTDASLLPAKLSPIALDVHPLNNPWLSYNIYLSNLLLPAFLCMFVMFMTCFSISDEIKRKSSREWLQMGNNSIILSLLGKLLPQTLIFAVLGALMMSVLYFYQSFPLNNGFFPLFLAMIMVILASQAIALFATGCTRRSRISLSVCALWGVISFSICGFTYPVDAMPVLARVASYLFPLRHYYLIYVDQALNGIPIIYSWVNYAFLAAFFVLPLFILPKLKLDMLKFTYLQ